MINSKKIILCLTFVFVFTFFMSGRGFSEGNADINPQDIIDEQLEELSLDKIDQIVDSLNNELNGLAPELHFSRMVRDFITGGFKFNWKELITGIFYSFFGEVVENTRLLGRLLILVVISSLLKVFQDAFKSSGIANLSNAVIYLLLLVVALDSFYTVTLTGSRVIETMVDFMHALLPTLFTLLISIGAIGSATIFQPLIFLVVSTISTVIKVVVFPLISLAVALSVVSSFTREFSLSRLGGFIKEIGVTILGLSFIVFFGVILIQGVGVSVADGISLRTAKYLTGVFVPIVGGMFADALEMVVGCSLLIQNAIGLIGMLVIFMMVVFPIVKILALVLIYKFISAIVQPIGEQVIVDCLNNLGNTLMLVFISVTTVAIMFFIVITITVGIANMSVMLR